MEKGEKGERELVSDDDDDDDDDGKSCLVIAFRAGSGTQTATDRKTAALWCKNRVRSCSPKEGGSDRGPLTLPKRSREKERG